MLVLVGTSVSIKDRLQFIDPKEWFITRVRLKPLDSKDDKGKGANATQNIRDVANNGMCLSFR